MDPIAQAQDDLRRERLMQFFRQILPWAALILVLIIGVVAVREIMAAVRHGHDAKQTEQLATALNGPDSIKSLTEASKTLDGNHAALAKLIAFQRMSVEDQKSEGIVLLDSLAADDKAPKIWTDYAALTAVKARIAYGATTKDASALLTVLTPVTTDKTSPWRVSALIQTALIQGEMQGDYGAGLKTLSDIDLTKLDPRLGAQITTIRLHYTALTQKAAKP